MAFAARCGRPRGDGGDRAGVWRACSPGHVSCLLRASAAWCAQRWLGVKKAQVGGGSIVWVDQSGFYLLPGEAPTHASDKIRVHYLGLHDLSLAPQDTLSLPDEDLELLIQFVKMRALEERLANETLAADPTSDLVARLGHNARQAKEEFYRLLAQRQRATGSLVRWND